MLANPVMTASGTFGYGTEYSHIFDIQKLATTKARAALLSGQWQTITSRREFLSLPLAV